MSLFKSSLLLSFLLLVSSFSFENSTKLKKASLSQQVQDLITKSSLPDNLKTDVNNLAKNLFSKGKYTVSINKKVNEPRSSFVVLQGVIELFLSQLLENNFLEYCYGAIHTPTPTSPLCITLPSSENSSTSMEGKYHLSVSLRAYTLREYLRNNGNLYLFYPESGRQYKSFQELKTFDKEIEKFKNRISNIYLKPDFFKSQDEIGAFYIFSFKDCKEPFFFSIKSTQINSSSMATLWGVWFGAISSRNIKNRMKQLSYYINYLPIAKSNEKISKLFVNNNCKKEPFSSLEISH